MSGTELQRLIGDENTTKVIEMGGVVSIVFTSAVSMVVLGRLTPEEGLRVFEWAVKRETELEVNSDPEKWQAMVRDSMSGRPLRERGEIWFKQKVNDLAEDPIYEISENL